MSTLPAISGARPLRSLGAETVLRKVFSFPVLLVALLLFVGCIWSGNGDVDPGGVLSDYLRLTWLEPHSLSVLQKYNIQACLIKSDAPLATVLGALPEWQIAYRDELSTLFIRKKALLVPASPVATEVSRWGNRASAE